MFRVLGPLEVWDGGGKVPVPVGRQRALLAYLVVHRDSVVTTDRLVDELWPTAAPPTAPKIVRNLVSELRKLIGATDGVVLETEARGYRLRIPADDLDAARFEALATEGRRLLEHGDHGAAAEILREALGLWRGAAYADVADEPFVRGEATRLEELRLACLEERIEADLALGRHAELVPELEALVRREPLRERLRAQLMLALYRSGRQADALAEYQTARRTLVEELGLEPGRGLRELESSILAQDQSLDLPEHARLTTRRRAQWLIGLGGAALLLATMAIVFAATRGGEVEGLASLAPNTVGAIDPETGRIVVQVPLGAAAARLAGSKGVLWALSTTEKTLYRIDAERRELTGTARLDGLVADVAATDDDVWVLHAGPSGETVLTGYAADQPAPLRLDSVEPGTSLLGAGLNFGTADDRIAVDDDTLWVTTTAVHRGGALVVDRASRRVRDRLPGYVYGLALDGDAAWLVAEQLLRRVNSSLSVDLEIPLPSPGVAPFVAVGEGAVWAVTVPLIRYDANGSQRIGRGVLTRVDPETEAVATTIPIGGIAESVAAGLGSVWITDIEHETLVRVDPDTDSVAARIPLGARPTEVAIAGGLVWVAVI